MSPDPGFLFVKTGWKDVKRGKNWMEQQQRWPGKNARWEPLGKNCQVWVTDDHGFNLDTLLLADFSLPRRGEACADLGTGCGAIPLLWKCRGAAGRIWGVELQEEAVRQARFSVEKNGFSREISILQGDVREVRNLFSHQQLNLVTCNPPYFPMGSGIAGEKESRRKARLEETMTLEDLADAARYALRQGGRLCLCLPVARLAEALFLFRGRGLEPKRLRMVQQHRGKPPYLFLLECRNGGKSGLEAEPALLLREKDGEITPELAEIYGDYRENAGWKGGN